MQETVEAAASTSPTRATATATATPTPPRIGTLDGGIAAYLAWVASECAAGHMKAEDSLFHGRNYVFDARGTVGLADHHGPTTTMGSPTIVVPATATTTATAKNTVVARCHGCAIPSDRLSECRSPECRLVLVVCGACESSDGGGVHCCESCREDAVRQDLEQREMGTWRNSSTMCACERAREEALWRGGSGKVERKQGWKQARRKAIGRR